MKKKITSKRKPDRLKTSVAKRKKPKARKVVRHLTEREIDRLLKSATADREKRIITIMLNTGMHPSVMSNPENYEMELVNEETLMWYRPKTYALCIWNFEDGLKDLVEDFTDNDVGYHRSFYHDIVTGVAERAKLKHISPITLRHTATVQLLKADKSIEEVKQIIQCSDRVLWQHYARITGAEELGIERAKEKG